nr:hypothetical protein [Candidatus Sigynarchaeota archaeon]
FGLYVALTILSFMAMLPVYNKNKMHFNPINNAYMSVIFAMWVTQTFGFVGAQFDRFVLGQPLVIGAALDVSFITGFGLQAILLLFFLYIKNWKIHYPLPLAWVFFIIIGLIEFDNSIPTIISSIIISSVIITYFLRKGIKNRDGNLFAFGMFMVSFTLVEFIIHQPGSTMESSLAILGPLFGMVALNFGTWGWLDRNVFYDRELERKIKDTWVSKMMGSVVAQKKPATVHDGRMGIHARVSKQVMLECPFCHSRNEYLFPADIVAARASNTRGIEKIMIDKEKICEHAFSIYVDRNFDVRGYSVAA